MRLGLGASAGLGFRVKLGLFLTSKALNSKLIRKLLMQLTYCSNQPTCLGFGLWVYVVSRCAALGARGNPKP